MDHSKKKKASGIITIIKIKKQSKTTRRKVWSREFFLGRDAGKDKENTDMVEELLLLENPNSLQNMTIMSKENFVKILDLVGPHITKQDTTMREAISASTRLLITLRYLATGNTFKELSQRFRVSIAAISILIPKTIKSIYDVLSRDYFKECNTTDEWKQVANGFKCKWNFPMCLGAIGGKHIAIKIRAKEASCYVNYKGFNSIIVIAVVDADYKFIMVDVSTNGANDEASAFNNSSIGHTIDYNNLFFPDDEELPGIHTKMPHVFLSTVSIGDRLLKPYNGDISEANKTFNYRLSRAKSVVDKAFCLLSNRFQILQKPINVSVEKVEILTLACCVLHNFLLTENQDELLVRGAVELAELEKYPDYAISESDSDIRNTFCNYFNEVDILPWQQDAINKFIF